MSAVIAPVNPPNNAPKSAAGRVGVSWMRPTAVPKPSMNATALTGIQRTAAALSPRSASQRATPTLAPITRPNGILTAELSDEDTNKPVAGACRRIGDDVCGAALAHDQRDPGSHGKAEREADGGGCDPQARPGAAKAQDERLGEAYAHAQRRAIQGERQAATEEPAQRWPDGLADGLPYREGKGVARGICRDPPHCKARSQDMTRDTHERCLLYYATHH